MLASKPGSTSTDRECALLKPNPLSVLIIDDNETMRAMLRMIIQSDHYNVVGEANKVSPVLNE